VSETGPELRRDELTGEWVVVAAQRQDRPNLPDAGCPFCVGGLEAPAPYEVRAFPNRWPSLVPGPPLEGLPRSWDGRPARGAAEIILYSPDHDASLATLGADAARRIVDLWAERTVALLARPEIAYVLVFENRGREVGATIDHPHGQLYAFSFVPPVPARELAVAASSGCPVCAQLHREDVARTRVVIDTDDWLGFVPYASGWPYGLLLAPRTHVDGLPALAGDQPAALAAVLVDALGRYDRLFGRPFPYMLWVHQQPGDELSHLHVHVAPPRRSADALRYVAAGELGSGTLFNPVPPEAAADAFRRAGRR
jgi:UDPglucose--hexose-1-phosphate uridylyltransferase